MALCCAYLPLKLKFSEKYQTKLPRLQTKSEPVEFVIYFIVEQTHNHVSGKAIETQGGTALSQQPYKNQTQTTEHETCTCSYDQAVLKNVHTLGDVLSQARLCNEAAACALVQCGFVNG